MQEARVSKLVPRPWYTDKAEAAAAFHASILPNSKVDGIACCAAKWRDEVGLPLCPPATFSYSGKKI
jgi:predicted 3-demethylubiquinone-9 3-methyltransferase (glyoxalase superfamily)